MKTNWKDAPLITQGRYHNISSCKPIRRGIGGIADI